MEKTTGVLPGGDDLLDEDSSQFMLAGAQFRAHQGFGSLVSRTQVPLSHDVTLTRRVYTDSSVETDDKRGGVGLYHYLHGLLSYAALVFVLFVQIRRIGDEDQIPDTRYVMRDEVYHTLYVYFVIGWPGLLHVSRIESSCEGTRDKAEDEATLSYTELNRIRLATHAAPRVRNTCHVPIVSLALRPASSGLV